MKTKAAKEQRDLVADSRMELIREARALYVRRNGLLTSRNRITNAKNAYMRTAILAHRDLSWANVKNKKKIVSEAALLTSALCATKGKDKEFDRKKFDALPQDLQDAVAAHNIQGLHETLVSYDASAAPFDYALKKVTAEAEKLYKKFTAMVPYVESQKGLGMATFVWLVGACGDLSNYAHPQRVWKRMEMAVIDGEAQRRCKNVEKAIKHGFRGQRRALMYANVHTCMMKQSKEYLQNYYDRKAHYVEAYTEKAKEENWLDGYMNPTKPGAKKLTKAAAEKQVEKRVHAKASVTANRWCQKRVLRDLYFAWVEQYGLTRQAQAERAEIVAASPHLSDIAV